VRELRREEPIIGPSLRRALPALRAALVLVPVAWLARRVDVSLVLAHLGSLPPLSAAHSLAWASLSMYCFTQRWRLLLRAWGATPPSAPESLSLVLRSTFWNLLPGGLMGDLARSDAVRHTVGGLGNALAAIWFERLGGLAGLFVVALAAQGLSSAPPRWLAPMTLLGLMASLGLLALSLAAMRSSALARRLAALPLLGPRLGALTPPTRPGDLALGLLLSLGTQSAAVLSLTVVVHSLAPASELGTVAALGPAAVLLTFVPITPAGVGQREAVFSMVYAQAGIGAEVAVAASVSSFALGLLFPLVGALLTLLRHARASGTDDR
jgi:uncharacterized membrane protein YbhN (UPF0104 family)